ncbi:hypothetical protein EDB89DRAFT_2069420 [Lactarius sanguifluus]|nr:hypothetical protein EDB89DRAFT_2069420 [Lactarius sanguifluus]
MPGYPENIADPEQGESVSLGGEAWSLEDLSYHDPGGGTTGNSSSEGPFPAGSHKERRDFDDGANALWSLYGKEAKTHDEAQIVSLADDMDGVLLFAGLFSAVLTSFLVQSLQTLQVNPADQSVYYQNQSVYYQQQSAYYQQQSVAILAQISQQIASVVLQVSVPSEATSPTVPRPSVLSTAQQVFIPYTAQQVSPLSTPPLPYPAFEPSFPDIRVNAFWLVSLVCSLSAALLAILIQQERDSDSFFFEGAKGMRKLAEQVPRLIHVSLFLFFLGLGDSMLNTNTTVGVTTIVLICICASCYLYIVSAQLRNPQSPYKTLISNPIFFLMQRFRRPYFGDGFLRKLRTAPTSIEKIQEELVMGETEERKDRDGRSDPDTLESQTDRSSAGSQVSLPRPIEGTAVDTICRCVRNLFETCNNHSYFPNEEARRRRMRACTEAAASLVCCIDFRLEWLGEVGKLVSEIGHIEKINQSPTTTSDPSFIVRWTCLSLVAVQQILCSNRLQGACWVAWRGAQRIEECLKTAWGSVEELRRAFEPLSQKRTSEQVEEILRNHERQISELERIKVEADSMEDVDWRISLYQDAMDDATFRLTRQLPGVSFDEPHRSESSPISDNFNTPVTGSGPVTPQLIFPGQRVQALARLGLKLREVLDRQVADGPKEVLESLKSVDRVPMSLRRPDGLMKRQLVAPARSTRWWWSWVYRRTFLPLPETTFIDTLIARIK